MKPTEIIMPTTDIDKDKLTEDEKTALLSDAFRMEDHHTKLEPAKNVSAAEQRAYFDGDENMLKPPGNNPEVASIPLIRGKMTPGMRPILPLEAHATAVSEDPSLDDVAPMNRAKVLEDRAKEAK